MRRGWSLVFGLVYVSGGRGGGRGSTISIKIAHHEEKEFVPGGRASPYKTLWSTPLGGGSSYFIRVLWESPTSTHGTLEKLMGGGAQKKIHARENWVKKTHAHRVAQKKKTYGKKYSGKGMLTEKKIMQLENSLPPP